MSFWDVDDQIFSLIQAQLELPTNLLGQLNDKIFFLIKYSDFSEDLLFEYKDCHDFFLGETSLVESVSVLTQVDHVTRSNDRCVDD